MEELKTFVEWIKDIGLIGLLILLAFPITRQWLGFEKPNNNDALADALNKALVENDQSPILVKAKITRICDDIREIKTIQASNTSRQEQMLEKLSYISGKLDLSNN